MKNRGQGQRRYWERQAASYDRSMMLLGKPLPRVLELVGEALSGTERVLEVAAGTGLVTSVLARRAAEVVATDYAEAMVERLGASMRAQQFNHVRCLRADIYALPFQNHSFDVVVAANVLHLVPDLPGALHALARVAKPGARLLAPTFCHAQTPASRMVSRLLSLTGFPGQRRFSEASLRQALEEWGLTDVRGETVPGVLPMAFIEGRFADV